MPMASEEDRKAWGGELGVGEDKAIDFLISRGYKLTRESFWIMPENRVEPFPEEYDAICFLIHEWDFGGFAK